MLYLISVLSIRISNGRCLVAIAPIVFILGHIVRTGVGLAWVEALDGGATRPFVVEQKPSARSTWEMEKSTSPVLRLAVFAGLPRAEFLGWKGAVCC